MGKYRLSGQWPIDGQCRVVPRQGTFMFWRPVIGGLVEVFGFPNPKRCREFLVRAAHDADAGKLTIHESERDELARLVKRPNDLPISIEFMDVVCRIEPPPGSADRPRQRVVRIAAAVEGDSRWLFPWLHV